MNNKCLFLSVSKFVVFVVFLGLFSDAVGDAAAAEGQKKRKQTNWSQVRGANYIASYARNAAEVWSKFDPEILDRELGYAQSLGLNSVRVWLDYWPYEADPTLMLSRLEHFLKLCDKHELQVMLVLFDSCATKTEEQLQKKEQTVDPHWKHWAANPGYRYLDPEHWKPLEAYVKAIVGAHLNDPRVQAWDVMNEPWAGQLWSNPQRKPVVTRFVRHFCEVVNDLKPQAPITVGVTFLERAEMVEDLVEVISFHRYLGPDPKKWKAHLEEANQYSKQKGKPILLTEWGYPTWGAQRYAKRIMTGGEQAKFYREILPVMTHAQVGWYVFDLVMGYGPFARISILKPNGEPRPAAVVIEKHLKQEKPHEQ